VNKSNPNPAKALPVCKIV